MNFNYEINQNHTHNRPRLLNIRIGDEDKFVITTKIPKKRKTYKSILFFINKCLKKIEILLNKENFKYKQLKITHFFS